MAIYNQVCFYRWLFGDPVKRHWYIAGPVKPLGSTNKDSWNAKLLPMTVLTYYVDFVHFCYLLSTQRHCLCPNGRLQLPTHPHDITGVVRKLSLTSSEYYVRGRDSYKTLAVRLSRAGGHAQALAWALFKKTFHPFVNKLAITFR